MHIRQLVSVVLLAMVGSHVHAQSGTPKVPRITLGRIQPTVIKGGKAIPTPTTRRDILKYNLLLADVPNCRVVEYKCSIIAPGQGFYGPIYVTGGELTDSLQRKIKATPGPGVKLYIEDIRINYRGNIMDADPVVVTYDD